MKVIVLNAKLQAAVKAVERIENGMIVGLGTGSTAYYAIQRIAERIIREGLRIQAVTSSKASEQLAIQLGIPLVPFSRIDTIDVTIDGADEVDAGYNMIKGGGGALLREKILAANSKHFIVIVDESKIVSKLGKFPLPVEIIPFASELTIKKLRIIESESAIRMLNGQPYITDNGNLIIDCDFKQITNPEELGQLIKSIPGVVEHGLFTKMTDTIIVGKQDGTTLML
jgi:ribose 5-phosphate isomerase A